MVLNFAISNANWWLEAWTDDIENMHIGNESSSLYCH